MTDCPAMAPFACTRFMPPGVQRAPHASGEPGGSARDRGEAIRRHLEDCFVRGLRDDQAMTVIGRMLVHEGEGVLVLVKHEARLLTPNDAAEAALQSEAHPLSFAAFVGCSLFRLFHQVEIRRFWNLAEHSNSTPRPAGEGIRRTLRCHYGNSTVAIFAAVETRTARSTAETALGFALEILWAALAAGAPDAAVAGWAIARSLSPTFIVAGHDPWLSGLAKTIAR
jgi:hypothetical protein